MNIIELFENAGIYKENLSSFSHEDIIKVKKQFDTERSQDPSLDVNLADNLILAINEFPKELLFISNNRILYNFFSKKNYSRNRFNSDFALSINDEQVKSFINRFLYRDLDLYFDECLAQNRFDNIEDLLVAKEYLPEESMENLGKKIAEKLDFTIAKTNENPNLSNVSDAIQYLKYRSFYVLVSHFRSVETDKRIKAIYNKIFGLHKNSSVRIEFEEPMINGLVNYKAVDQGLNAHFRSNKDRLEAENDKISDTGRSSGISGWSAFFIIIVILRLIGYMLKAGRV
jgi:hypothetical protein